jgi:hypothetical protein
MVFTKTAKVPLITLAEGKYSGSTLIFTRTASAKAASVYQDGSREISVKDMLDKVAKDYNISDNPHDYIFEAARAVTAETANENGDAFERSELLRFDHRLAKAVYQTFILKPHHINHRADNPKTARGLVLDASYNDLSPVMEICPGCDAKTASVEARDSSGINCRKCGHAVKDEFVELLIAIDTKKDPTFAEGVKRGSLDSLSMGCEAGYTDCSICENRARTVNQFCSHIKSGNKKKIFKTASGPKMSYEKCGEVVFTEISRVDQPADPTAKQREVFQISPHMESEMLLLASRIAKLESKLYKGAQLQADDSSLLDKLEELKGVHPELYNELKQGHPELFQPSDDQVPEPMSIDDYEKKRQESMEKNMTSAEMGVRPEEGSGLKPTAASNIASSINADLSALIAGTDKVSEDNKVSTLKFAKSYSDLEVEVTSKGNIRVFTPKGTLFVVRPEVKPVDAESGDRVATEILTNIAEDGLVATANKYYTVLGPHIASVLDFHVENFAGGREDGDKGPITDKGQDKMNALPREKPDKSMVKEEHTDRKDEIRDSKSLSKNDILEDEVHNHKEKFSPNDSILDDAMGDLDKARSKAPKSTQDDVTLNFKEVKVKKASTDKKAELPDFLKKDDADGDDKKATPKSDKEDKKAQMMPPMAPGAPSPSGPAPTGAGPAMAAPAGACNCADGCKCDPAGCECKGMEHCACPCSGKMAQGDMGAMPMIASKKQTRLERLYKGRLDRSKAESAEKLASLEKTAVEKAQTKLLRALKLAAKRQALNLEESPLKAKMFDVLASEMDIDHDSYYPGMDAEVASRLIEVTAAESFDGFVDSIVKRATEFLAMNEDALKAIEADIKNLRPAPVTVQASSKRIASSDAVRKTAMDGNLVVAPSATNEGVSSGNKRDNIRSALDTTMIRRTSQAYFNK